MKTRIAMQFLAFIAGVVVLSDCKKEPEPIVEPIQTVFENLPLCELCTNDPWCISRKVEYKLADIEGKLYTYGTYPTTVYLSIKSDTLSKLSIPDISPLWKYNGGVLNICNMPNEIKNAKIAYKVRFSCKLLYMPLPNGFGVPSLNGYSGVELTKIEILNPTAK